MEVVPEPSRSNVSALQLARPAVLDFLCRPCQPVLDLDGTLLAHDLKRNPELQGELLGRVVEGFTTLQTAAPVIATNKTYAELGTLGIARAILFTENCSVLVYPKEVESQLASVFPAAELRNYDGLGMMVFGGNLDQTIERAEWILAQEFRDQLSNVFGRFDWHVVAAARALDYRYPEVSLRDVQESFGLTESSARESATRQGNTGLFIKSRSGELVDFGSALGRVVGNHSALWGEICARGRALGISFTPSSKAVSITSSKPVVVNTLEGQLSLPVGKGLAIELQRTLSGGRPVFFAGDAGNDLPGVERLKAGDLFCQMKSKGGAFETSLIEGIAAIGAWHYLCPEPAPVGVASLVAGALLEKSLRTIDAEADRQGSTLLSKVSAWQ